jgi:protein SCO1/2
MILSLNKFAELKFAFKSILAWMLVALIVVEAKADEPRFSLAPPQARILEKVSFTQRLDNQVPVGLSFQNEKDERVTLEVCIAGRPTVLVLAYYRCPMLCNQVLNGVVRTMRGIGFRPGQELSVVVVSFDPSDTPSMAAAKKSAIVDVYREGDDGAGWSFLTGEEASIRALADSVGFNYAYDATTNQFAHASGIVLLTPTGRVSRYFYGIDYPTRDVRMGLVEASANKIGNAVDELLLLCFHYDPLTGRYGLAIMRVIRTTSVLLVVGIAAFIWTSLRREQKQRRNELAASDAAPHETSWRGEA